MRGIKSNVYEPAEDTFFLARGVDCLTPCTALAAEIGCGKGFVTEALATYAVEVVATDVDYASAQATWQRAKSRRLDHAIHIICCDRLEAVRVGEVFDFVAFNPPYLPEEGDSRWSGGPTGIEVPLAFARSALMRLKRLGVIVFLLSSLSNWRSALEVLKSAGNIISLIGAMHVGLFEELLLVLCARRVTRVDDAHP
ncbi:MAG: methyltransferase [Thermofilaceae archaeon]